MNMKSSLQVEKCSS